MKPPAKQRLTQTVERVTGKRPIPASRDATDNIRPSGPNADPMEPATAADRLRQSADGLDSAARDPKNAGISGLLQAGAVTQGYGASQEQDEADTRYKRGVKQQDELGLKNDPAHPVTGDDTGDDTRYDDEVDQGAKDLDDAIMKRNSRIRGKKGTKRR